MRLARRRARWRGRSPAAGPGHRLDDLGLAGVAHGVDLGRPRGQVAAAHALGQLLPRGRVAAAGDGDHGVGLAAPVGQPQVPEQPAAVRTWPAPACTRRGRRRRRRPPWRRRPGGLGAAATRCDPLSWISCGELAMSYGLAGGGDAPVDRDDGAGQVGPGPRGEVDGRAGHVVGPADALQRARWPRSARRRPRGWRPSSWTRRAPARWRSR